MFFVLGVYLCIFATMFGCKHDPTRHILGHWFFSPLAKVSFCIYLTHFIVIITGVFSVNSNLYWQSSSSLYNTISDIFKSILLATTLSLLIESPTLALEKIFLRPPKKNKHDDEKQLVNVQKEVIVERVDESGRKVKSMTDTSARSSMKAEKDVVVEGEMLSQPLVQPWQINSPSNSPNMNPQG